MQDLKRKSTEELKAFVEISCTTSPNHLVSVRKAYCLLLNSSLAEYTGSEEAQLHKYDGYTGLSQKRMENEMVVEVFKKLQNPYEVGIMVHHVYQCIKFLHL
ncbi:hypothetical protein YC2023_121791 [Brassica napus]